MWKIDNYGNAHNSQTAEEIYSVYCRDGLYRVYRDHTVINTFTSGDDARDFIKKRVRILNGEED